MLRIILLLLTACSAILLPRPSGLYQLTLNESQLIDHSRPDPWGKDTVPYRRLMISRFEPLAPDTCYRNQMIPYMSQTISAVLGETFHPSGFPLDLFSNLSLITCFQPSFLATNTSWPIVLLSPGFNASRLMYSMLAQEIASQGFTVITIDHPFDTSVEFPDSSIAIGGNVIFSDINTVYRALDIRIKDISFVLNTLGIQYNVPANSSVVGIGGSFGGAAIAATMMNDTRIRGGMNLDGELFGGVINSGLGRPGINQSFVLWGAEGHNRTSEEDWGTFYGNLKREGMWVRELELLGAKHVTFSDVPLLVDVKGIRSNETQAVIGTVDGRRVLKVLSAYASDYFGFVFMGNRGEQLLDGPSREYPEVLFLG